MKVAQLIVAFNVKLWQRKLTFAKTISHILFKILMFPILGFIPTDSEVRYFGEDVPGVSQSFSEDQTFSYQDEEGTITVLGSPIKFDPPNLNFKEK